MDPSVEYLDKVPRFSKSNHVIGPNRADLLVIGVLLAVLAVATLGYGNGSGGSMVSMVGALALMLVTGVCFRGAVIWRNPAERGQEQAVVSRLERTPELIRISEITGSDRRSRAA